MHEHRPFVEAKLSNKRNVDPMASSGKRLCQNTKDLYGSGMVSAGRAQSLMEGASLMNATWGVVSIASHPAPGPET